MSSPMVTLISTRTLRPAGEIPQTKFPGTVFEHLAARIPYQKRVLFFMLEASEFEAKVQSLESSLCQALVHFYPLAGRIIVVEDQLLIDCTGDLSVRFSQACTDAKLEDLGSFEPSEFIDSLAQIEGPQPRYPWNPETPLLFVQVTRFACGGLSVGVAFSHQVCDGTSFWHFMNSWGEIARTGKLSLEPVVTYDYKPVSRSLEELKLCAEAVGIKFKDGFPGAHYRPGPPSKSEKLFVKRLKLTKERIQELKTVAAEQSGGKTFSSFEVITAYLWRRMAMARFQDDEKTAMVVLMNCREKFSLAKEYFGNAAAGTFSSCSVSEIRAQGFWLGASLMDDLMVSSRKHLDGWLGYMSKHLQQPDLFPAMEPFHGLFVVVSSPRHPVFETDFGFGRAVGVSFGTEDLDEGKLYLFPSATGDGSVDATVVLRSEAMERFNQL